MGGFFGICSKNDCMADVFFGVDYHSHLGTHRGGNVSEYSPTAPPVLPSVRRAPEPAPVVVGAGPAGLFAALTLCRSGAPCILLERGKRVEDRARDVDAMRNGGILSLQSNIQFGEGGAGTFSDGKLHTGIKSPYLFSILRELAENGAPEEILWNSEPHIGTDMLRTTCAGQRPPIVPWLRPSCAPRCIRRFSKDVSSP